MYIKMSEAKIIIIGGKSRSGKDTIASFIKNHYEKENKKVIILQYSHYIKEYAKTISDWDGSELDKPRRLLQVLGTDIIRNNIDVDFFTKRTIEDIKVYSYFYDIIIISDARFKREIELVKNSFNEVLVIGVKRTNYQSELTLEEKNHSTENDLDDYNFEVLIENNSTLENLELKVNEIFKD